MASAIRRVPGGGRWAGVHLAVPGLQLPASTPGED